jgi:hypothetical protein
VRCSHTHQIKTVPPSALGYEGFLRMGSPWVHLRLCRSCGHVGCCDQSPNRHARQHFEATGHPIIEGYDPPEGWGCCYIDDVESICQARRCITVQSRASSKIKFDRKR